MPTTTKRAPAKAAGPASSPLVTAVLLAAAVGYGVWLLVERGRISWPPNELLSSAYTLAGCLAVVGPLVLSRRDAAEGGLGDLLWMTGGLLIWVFDLAALARGEGRALAWLNPLGVRVMGLTVLAVLLAGWRLRGLGRGWSWTNIVGWLLGAFWIGMAAATLWPARVTSLAVR
jgi:hypothetical protein